jgi:cell division protein FtsB
MSSTATRRIRIKWVRIAALAVTVYVGAGVVTSAWHWWRLDQQAHQLAAQIVVVQHNNAVLSHDLHEMRNPTTLRRMLSGQAPLPNAIWPNP